MEKVAVLPVPDWACAMTSCPLTTGTMARCWIAEGRSKLHPHVRICWSTPNVTTIQVYSPVSVNTTEKLRLQLHVVEAVDR